MDEYNRNLKKAEALEKQIALWTSSGEYFLTWLKILREEQHKYTMQKASSTRLSLAIPNYFTKDTLEGVIETSLIFSSLLSSGRADSWKEAANLTIEDKYKQSVLREISNTKQSLIDSMVKVGRNIEASISDNVHALANSISDSVEHEGIKNQLAMNNINNSLDRIQVINGALLIDTLLK